MIKKAIQRAEMRAYAESSFSDQAFILPDNMETNGVQLMTYAFRNSPNRVIFVGKTTEECRKRCFQDLLKNTYLEMAIVELAAFCQKTPQTILRWLEGKDVPRQIDWLRFQYWLRAKGYKTTELDTMFNAAFRLRKYIICGEISFIEATKFLGFPTQETLWAVLNNEVTCKTHGKSDMCLTIGLIHTLVRCLDDHITAQEYPGYAEVELDIDGEFAEVKARYRLMRSEDNHGLDHLSL